jgi:hypothetical protein
MTEWWPYEFCRYCLANNMLSIISAVLGAMFLVLALLVHFEILGPENFACYWIFCWARGHVRRRRIL